MQTALVESTLPGFVKRANSSQLFGTESEPATAFADPARRQYYIGTKAGVWMSADQFRKVACADQTVRENITRAAKIHNIVTEIAPMLIPAAEMSKTAAELPDSQFGLVIESDGTKSRHFRLQSHEDIKTASLYFQENKRHLTGEQRQKFASAILRRAAEEQVDLPSVATPELQKYAGEGEYTVAGLQSQLRTRQLLLGPETYEAKQLETLVPVTSSRLPVPQRQKIAAWLTDFDTEFKLDRHYGAELADPHETLFGISKDAIEEVLDTHVQLPTGVVFCKQDLKKIAAQSLQAALGDEVVAPACGLFGVDSDKLASILPTLSKSQAERFSVCARQSGVTPVV